jgi:FKBP-type peptidyl-prolyl cis-trans isomerase SlyD
MSVQIVSFNCILKNKAGQLISSTVNRDVMTAIEGEAMLAGLANGLRDLKAGEKRTICLSAEEAYGFYDLKKVILYPRENLSSSAPLRCGERISLFFQSGGPQSFEVIEVMSDMIRLDGNHPLAGQDLIFEIEALSAREATQQEIDESNHNQPSLVLH